MPLCLGNFAPMWAVIFSSFEVCNTVAQNKQDSFPIGRNDTEHYQMVSPMNVK